MRLPWELSSFHWGSIFHHQENSSARSSSQRLRSYRTFPHVSGAKVDKQRVSYPKKKVRKGSDTQTFFHKLRRFWRKSYFKVLSCVCYSDLTQAPCAVIINVVVAKTRWRNCCLWEQTLMRRNQRCWKWNNEAKVSKKDAVTCFYILGESSEHLNVTSIFKFYYFLYIFLDKPMFIMFYQTLN